jgi:hypothetical protein
MVNCLTDANGSFWDCVIAFAWGIVAGVLGKTFLVPAVFAQQA